MNKRSRIDVIADTDKAKLALENLNSIIINSQRAIDRAFNSAQSNNNFVSNRQMAGAQNGIGRINDVKNLVQEELDKARATQTPSQLKGTESALVPELNRINQAIQQLTNSNARQWGVINGASTTSSRAFNQGYVYNPQSASYVDDKLNSRNFRSNVHNFSNTVDKVFRNYDTAQRTGYISYNRYQEYKASVASLNQRYGDYQKLLKPGGEIDKFKSRFTQTKQEYQRAEAKAKSPSATSADVRYARELDEQVKAMSKLNEQYEQESAQLEKAKTKLGKLGDAVDSPNSDVRIGYNPNSLKGFLYGRKFIIGRMAAASAYSGATSSISQGDNIRLNSFDDIKSTAYANKGRDNKTLRTLGDSGYRWGYDPGQMAKFAGAYTSSTGNVGSIKDVDRVASAWARQSRVTGGNAQSTIALETSAGNAVNMNSSQMTRLGNSITNSIINSGMNAKATQQQQGLAMLYNNGAKYGMTASDERNMAGFQASLSKYGSNMQGTQGAQAIMGMASTLGNYNNPAMRQLFAMNNPGRYMGIRGNARMLEDMQNLQKQPWKMRRILKNATRAYGGDKLVAAGNISAASGGSITVDQAEKMITAAQNGDMSQKQFEKYIKKTTQSGSEANKLYSKTGTSTLQKYNAALANSAIKASQAIDFMRKAISGVLKHSGPFGGAATGLLNAAGSVGGSIVGMWGLGKLGRFIRGKAGARVAEDIAKDVAKDGTKGGRFSKILRGGSFIKDSGKLAKYGRFAMRGAKSVGRSTGIGDVLLGGADLIGAFATTKKGTRARHRAVGASIGGTAGGILGGAAAGATAGSVFGGVGAVPGALIGGILGSFGGEKLGGSIGGMFGTTKKARAINKAKRQSPQEAKKTARKYNKSVHGSHLGKKGLIGAGIGLTGLGLADYYGDESHADMVEGDYRRRSKKRKNATSQNEDWKLLRGYNKMLDHAMRVVQAAKSIKAGGGDNSKSNDDDGGDIKDGDMLSVFKQVAKKVGKKTGIDPKMIMGQMVEETGGPDSVPDWAKKYHNLSGIKWAGQAGAKEGSGGSDDGGNYADFDSWNSFANAYAQTLNQYADDLKSAGTDPQKYAEILSAHHYFSSSNIAGYAAGLKRGMDMYATGGISTRKFAAGAGMIASQPTYGGPGDVFGEAGTEAYIPLNSGHYGSGLSALKDLAGLFGKQVVDQSAMDNSKPTTINPSYNINLTINGGTDNPDSLAQKVADRVRAMLNEYDQQQANKNRMFYYGNETSSQFV